MFWLNISDYGSILVAVAGIFIVRELAYDKLFLFTVGWEILRHFVYCIAERTRKAVYNVSCLWSEHGIGVNLIV
jgi:hypothetical protein